MLLAGAFHGTTAEDTLVRSRCRSVRRLAMGATRRSDALLLVVNHNLVKGLAVLSSSINREGCGFAIC